MKCGVVDFMASKTDYKDDTTADSANAASNTSAAAAGSGSNMIVGLNAWIDAAIRSLKTTAGDGHNNQHSNIVCSWEYLSCALKIAHSLADQLCVVDEKKTTIAAGGDGEEMDTSLNPSIIKEVVGPQQQQKNESLAHSIYVRCGARLLSEEKKDDGRANTFMSEDLEPLPLHHNPSEPDDLQIMAQQLFFEDKIDDGRPNASLNEDLEPLPLHHNPAETADLQLFAQELLLEEKIDDGKANASPSEDLEPLRLHHDPPEPEDLQVLAQQLSSLFEDGGEHTEYLNVECATLREDVVREMCINDDARVVTLHALGVTFFHLFSGGQKIMEEVKTAYQSSLGVLGTERNYDRHDHTSKKAQRTSPSSSTSSVEPLKLLGLPTALCDLISNMIDCTKNGGVTGDESYEAVSDVRDDLKLMMDSPDVYLRDLNMTHASNVGLQMESVGGRDGRTNFYGRELELEMLKESYHRSLSSGCEVAMIYGSSGIGKSMLSNKFAETMKDGGGGIFLSGSFDKLQQSQPFHVISSAFDEYCTWLSGRDKSTVEMVASALKRGDLGGEISSLVTVMPNLGGILGSEFICDKNDDDADDAVDAQKRLRYLFCRFVEIILGCQEEPLVLFLDDCQWIDAASAALLNQVLIMPKSATNQYRFFFFGCCRDDEVSEAHPLTLMLSSLNTFGTKTTKIILTPMSKETVNEMVSTTLSLLPRLTRPLADILYHKTKGSPFFVKQLMIELYKRRLLYPSLTRCRWVWESDNIRDMEIPESVAAFIMNSFHSLPPAVLSALCVLSCFGVSVSISLVEALETEIHTPLKVPLERAIAESIMDKRKGEYHFLHDKLQEAAYSLIRPEQRCLQHFRYGLALGNVAVRERDDMLLITAVSQINHGGPQAVIDSEQGVAVASLNLDAGKKAMKMSDFFSAHSFFDHGISYLRKGHWEKQYDLSLELFNLAAKCALMNAEHASLEVLIGQIMHHAQRFEDKCQAISISITLLLLSGNVREGVKTTLSTLTSLGEELSRSPWWLPKRVIDLITPTVIHQHLGDTKAKLAGLSDATLLGYREMVEPSKIMAMELLAKLCELLGFIGETTKLPIIPSKMIQISLKHGMSPLSPLAFVQHGNYLAIIRENYDEGYRYVKLGLSLMKQRPSRAHDCQVIFHSTFIRLHVEPKQTAVEFFRNGSLAAMKSGDTRYAMKCAYFYDSCCFWAGKKLEEVVKSMEETIKKMRFHKNLLLFSIMLPIVRLSLRMIGESVIPQQIGLTSAFGETHNEEDIADKIPTIMLTKHFNMLYEAYIFRDFEETRDRAEKYLSLQSLTMFSGAPMYNRIFYFGLVSFWTARDLNNKKYIAKKWIARGAESKVAIEKLAVLASTWNFQNKSYLLQAEEQFCARNFEAAEKLYDNAILSSKKHKFVNEEALANELAGYFYLDTGRSDKSVHYFSQAEEKYREWGAVAKATTLGKYLDCKESLMN